MFLLLNHDDRHLIARFLREYEAIKWFNRQFRDFRNQVSSFIDFGILISSTAIGVNGFVFDCFSYDHLDKHVHQLNDWIVRFVFAPKT